ncbi:uncharacterized protein [Typha angustifolia]|uniref:uncharacterized protein n=1 Tax=Typha angustifolia TaxID=59011 RepID=UPI003C2C76FE
MQYMAQDGSEASVASSSSGPNWPWEMHPWSSTMSSSSRSWQPHNPTSHSSCDDQDLSISNHSGLSMDSSPAAVDTHLWNQVLLNAGGMRHEDDDGGGGGENFLEALNAKSLTSEMYDPACDYLKKMDHSSWEFASNPSPTGYGRMTANLSDLVSNWSIAPPDPHLAPSAACDAAMAAHYSASAISHVKHEIPHSPSYRLVDGSGSTAGCIPCYDQFNASDGVGYQIGLNNSVIGLSNKLMNDVPWSNTRNLSDLISFSSSFSKPAVEVRASKPYVKSLEIHSDTTKKQGCEISSTRVMSSRSSGATSEGKKKRSEDSSETLLKKSKHESSTTSSLKLQVPKVKIADKITALQQIVSPFGKTDTASVLLEAIKYIRFLHEQVQLLSDPYMKSSVSKDQNAWGLGKEKGDPKVELRNRGLCLVPISCTPQVYRDNSGPDYWTPPYSSCLYR